MIVSQKRESTRDDLDGLSIRHSVSEARDDEETRLTQVIISDAPVARNPTMN